MNKFTVLVVVLFLSVMGVLFYQSKPNNEMNNIPSEKLEVDIIKPINIIKTNEDVKQSHPPTALNLTNSANKLSTRDTKNTRPEKSARKETYEYPFTEEGQAYMTLGELLLKDRKNVDTTNFSATLFKQMEQAKYNLKLAKEIASISKKLYIEKDGKKEMDPEVYAKMNELSKNLIVTVKKQQNIE